MSSSRARFHVGQVVHHLRFDYRGVVLDVDPEFGGSDAWYEQVALSRPPRDRPWYQVLVDGSTHRTYVAERHLEPDGSGKPVRHPEIENHFSAFEGGRYLPRVRRN